MAVGTTKSRSFRTFLLAMQLERQEILDRLRQARKERGLTQQEAADLLSVHKRTVENWENAYVPWERLNQVALIYGKTVEWFLYGDELPGADRLAVIEEELRQVRVELAAVRALLPDVERVLTLAHDLQVALQARSSMS